MAKNKWWAIGLGLGIAAASVFVLKKIGLLDFKRSCYESDDYLEDYNNFESDCLITKMETSSTAEVIPVVEEAQPVNTEIANGEAATEELAEEEKNPE